MSHSEIAEHKLQLAEVLNMLVADGLVGRDDADALIAERKLHRQDQHPLLMIAEKAFRSALPPNKTLTLETLTEWLAQRVKLEYLHIDPLKIDFSSVTDLMSNDYAGRFSILPCCSAIAPQGSGTAGVNSGRLWSCGALTASMRGRPRYGNCRGKCSTASRRA